MNRRQFLAASAAGLLAGCGRKPTGVGVFAGRELRVFVYAGGHERTMREAFVPAFEAATGATVTLYPGWWEGTERLKASPANDPPFDLIITDATKGFPAAREGLFAQLDWDRIPNKAAMPAAALDNWIVRDRYGLTYPDSVMTLAFNRERATEPPARWADLLRPDLAGKLGLYNHFYMTLFTFAAALADSAGKAGTAHELIAKQIDDVFRFAREHRSRVKLWWPTSNDMILALANGEVAAGNMHSPEYLQALREKPALGAAVPAADRAMVQVFWAIPAGTPNGDLAEVALNALFSFDTQVAFARRGMAAARLDAAEVVAADDPLWKGLYPHTAEQFHTLRYYPYDVYAGQWDALADRWDWTVLRG